MGNGKTTIIKSESSFGMRIFNTVIGVAAYCTLFVTLFSALPQNPAYYTALPLGAALITVFIVFYKNKFVRFGVLGASLLFTVLCVAAGFSVFSNGVLGFVNSAIESLNANRHYGLASFVAQNSFGSDFLFAFNVSIWFAVFTAFAVKKQYVFICIEAFIFVLLLCVGLYPHYTVATLFVFVLLCLLSIHNGFTLRASIAYFICALLISLTTIPCYFFGGSKAIDNFNKQISDSIQNTIYGNSMPNGKLSQASGMRTSKETRLKLTVSPLTSTLYLKGFVGSDFNDSYWNATDKNIYVQNGYQGLLEYISEVYTPITQYAEYTKLNGRSNSYELTVENVSADRRYIYAPYTLTEFAVGDVYYDMGLRGGILTPQTYTHTIFAADESRERLTQADWLTQNFSHTVAMENYIRHEEQYRAFVYDVYLSLDESIEGAVKSVVGEFQTNSINTATQFIRSYFLDSFSYSDNCDALEASFSTEFFGGDITHANSSYFATAATVMFRSLGFASRYVEGYLVDFEDDGTNGVSLSVDVTGENTHAWTEVYFDGMGWLPIEVTPTFFSEQPSDTIVAPDDENADDSLPSNPDEQPDVPSENPDIPDKPIEPPKKPDDKDDTNQIDVALITALKVLIPIASVAAFVLLLILSVAVRRQIIRRKRRNLLNSDGEKFGKAAYGIMQHDCKNIGGFDAEALEKIGVSANGTARFMRIVERCVYGESRVDEADRSFVVWYVNSVQNAILSNSSFFKKLYYKHILCLVI